jgi:hypothetical protein
MKIVCIDNYNRESRSDVLIAENVHKYFGEVIVEFLNKREGDNTDNFFVLKEDGYKLWRGMEELV